MALTLPKLPKAPLKDRIAEIRAEIDAFIDAKAEELKTPGIPLVCIRRDLTSRAGDCQCRQYLINTGELK
ncbi:MAG TPA: hypothetical protein VKY22_29420 [Bradyrhizobium sp.]|nr:hypothetical protein [Bradyrhizobium sp.]